MARNEWLGNAQAVAQISTITFANTWATADTTDVECNGKHVIVATGAAATVSDVAAAVKAALNGDALVGSESRNTTGDLIPEFTEVTPTVNGAVVTLTGVTPGVPFTFSVTVTTAGSGTAVLATTTTAAGPNDALPDENWSNGFPVNGDDLVIARPISLLYNLDALAAVAPASLTIHSGFWANGAIIGLPRISGQRNTAYNEYRPTALQLNGCAAAQIGLEPGSGQTLINLDFGTGTVDLSVLRVGTSVDPSRPALCVAMNPGSAANGTLEVISGTVGVGFYGESCKVTPRIGYRSNPTGDANVSFGAGVTIGATFDMSGGTVELNTGSTVITKSGGELTINGTGAHAALDNFGGEVFYNSTGTLGATRINVGGGATLDFSRDMSAKTQGSTILLCKGAALVDPHGVVGSLAFRPLNCRLADVKVVSPNNKTFTAS